MINLKEWLINEHLPDGPNGCGWCAGDQLGALRFYLDEEILFLKEYKEDDYSGDCYALMSVGKTLILWRDGFGSCSGCDSLDGQNGYEYIKDTLREGNIKQFNTYDEMRLWFASLNKGEKYFWENIPRNFIEGSK